jgi:hypothetical protein
MSMSREEILKLSAGRETDILVAERVMGWQIETDQAKLERLGHYVSHPAERTWWRDPQGGWHVDPPRYSSDIVAAWQVVSAMSQRGHSFFLFQSLEESRAAFGDPDVTDTDYLNGKDVTGAICKAALAAVARPLWAASPAGVSVK